MKKSHPVHAPPKVTGAAKGRTHHPFTDPSVRMKSATLREMADAMEEVYREGALLMEALDDSREA